MFESFVKNLWSQLKDPTRFGILSVKEQALDDPKVRQAIEDLAAGKKTDAVAEFLAKYDITPKGKGQSINNQNDKEMAKQEQTNPGADPTGRSAQVPIQRIDDRLGTAQALRAVP